ncbi:MAG: MFS transporter [Candidatus Accumulibacter sp.]|nr:MFS transporter [Accumulibacter sp.]
MKTLQAPTVRKVAMMVSGALLVAFTGLPHVWSVFLPTVMAETGWSHDAARLCFYLALGLFVPGNILGGRWQDRASPRRVIAAGGGLFVVSLLLCALPPRLPFFYLSYGLLQGLGSGMVYIAVVTQAQKCFPGRSGFASGIIVAANGISGLFWAPFCRVLLVQYGMRFTFLMLAALLFAAWLLATACASPSQAAVPEAQGSHTGRPYRAAEMLRSPTFYLLAASMMLGLVAYMTVSPISQQLLVDRGVPAGTAVVAVMAGAVANALARLLVPGLGDRLGRARCLVLNLLVGAASASLLTFGGGALSMLAVALAYFSYGGVLGSFPSLTSEAFGMKHAGENYGYMLCGLAAATVLVPMGAALPLAQEGLFALGALASIGAALLMLLYMRTQRKAAGALWCALVK